jgi:hypothetical protein
MEYQPSESGGNRKPFIIVPSPVAKSHSTTNSTVPSNRTTPQRNVKPLFRISTTYSTLAARATSFQHQLLTGITPHQLAQNGLYHQVRAGVGDTACCFACETVVSLKAIQENAIGDLARIHKEDCLWQVICHDLKPFLPSPPNHACAPSSAILSSSTQITGPNSSSRPEPYSTPTALTLVNQAEPDLETPAELPPARLDSEPSAQRPATCPPQPTQPTKSTSPPKHQQRTYASVLQQPTTSSPQPTTKPHSTPPKPTLTIEDLYRRFHNKPSPFKLEKSKRKRPRTASAAQSLTRFLNSALPAFSRFLVEMQPTADNFWPPYVETQYNRAMRAA